MVFAIYAFTSFGEIAKVVHYQIQRRFLLISAGRDG
jgi:hypothetical protein